jgi:hypothetical protein
MPELPRGPTIQKNLSIFYYLPTPHVQSCCSSQTLEFSSELVVPCHHIRTAWGRLYLELYTSLSPATTRRQQQRSLREEAHI